MELTIENIIKIILGVLVFVAVIMGLYVFFKDNVFDFFNNVGFNGSRDVQNFILSLI